MNRKTFACSLLLALLPAAAIAQSASPPAPSASPDRSEARQRVRAACAPDIQKFCADIERAKGAMRACLDQNQAGLSQECSWARAERAALRAKEKG